MTCLTSHMINGQSQNSNPSVLLFSWFISPRSRAWGKGLSISDWFRMRTPGSTSRWAGNGDREGKAVNKGHVVKQATTIDNWSSILLGTSLCQCRHTSVLSHLRCEEAALFIHLFPLVGDWRLFLLRLSMAPTVREKKPLDKEWPVFAIRDGLGDVGRACTTLANALTH